MKRLVITQSDYIPWRGYFDLMARADLFLLYDTVQYTKQDWRNRNRIKTAQGLQWLTIPVHYTHTRQRICDTQVVHGWAPRHVRRLQAAYGAAPCFAQLWPQVAAWYAQCAGMTGLSDINLHLLRGVAQVLGIGTPIAFAPALPPMDATAALVALCQREGATHYLVGPKARRYLDAAQFARAGIVLEWMEYGPYPGYVQLHPPYDAQVSILDVLFHLGAAAGEACRPLARDAFPARFALV